jgi:hypothetical protein
MLKKVEAKCKRCKKEFCKERTEQAYCSAECRKAAWNGSKKRRLMPSHSKTALFPQSKQRPARHPLPVIWALSFESRS